MIAAFRKVAREIDERTLREIATSKGVDYDLVVEAAEEVVKQTDLLALAKAGKGGWDELVTKISERAAKKNADFVAKGRVSAATIAKFQDRIEPDRIKHILDGEYRASVGNMSGGHRFGQAKRLAKDGRNFGANHMEFPESWSDDEILTNILKVMDDTASITQNQGRDIVYENTIDTVKIRVVYDNVIKKVVTSYPIQ